MKVMSSSTEQGFFISTAYPRNKARQLKERHAAVEVDRPASFKDVPMDKALIVVVVGRFHDEAWFVWDPLEFSLLDQKTLGRPHVFMLMDAKRARIVSGWATHYRVRV